MYNPAEQLRNAKALEPQLSHERRDPQESLSFTQWEKQLNAATSYQEYLVLLSNLPFEDTNAQLDEVVFGVGGILEKFSNFDTEPPLPSLPRQEIPNDFFDPLSGAERFHDEYGWRHSVLLSLALACSHTSVAEGETNNKIQERVHHLLDAAITFQADIIAYQNSDEYWEGVNVIKIEDDGYEELGEQAQWEYDEMIHEGMDEYDGIREIKMLLKKSLEAGNGQECGMLLLSKIADVYATCYTRQLANHFSELDAAKAARVMLDNIRDDTKSNAEKSANRRILYLLEFGKIGIDAGVVSYLEQQYTLENADEYEASFARRITGDGKIGIFKEDGGLEGFFQLGNLMDEQTQRSAQVLEVAREMLFTDPTTPDSIRQQFLADYTDFYEKIFGEVDGVRMSDLTLREQVWVYQFWKDADDEIWEQVKRLKEIFGIDGIRTFIATEQNSEIGQQVLAFADQQEVSQQTRESVFRIYGSIIEKLGFVEQELQRFLPQTNPFDEDIKISATKEMAARAYQLLDRLTKVSDEKEVLALMRRVDQDIVVFATMFKSVFKDKQDIDFSDVQGLEVASTPVTMLSDEDKKAMVDIASANWSSRGAAGEGVLTEFQENLSSGDSTYHILRKDGVIVSFMRFDTVKDNEGEVIPGRKYAGSFNVDPNYRGSAIGEAMLVNVLEDEAKRNILEATVFPDIIVGTDYVEKRGFVLTNTLPNYDGSGETFFEIVLDKKENKKRATKDGKQYSREQFVQMFTEDFEGISLEELADQEIIVQRFDVSQERDSMLATATELFSQGYVGTRYFAAPENKDVRYYVFEREDAQEEVLAAAA